MAKFDLNLKINPADLLLELRGERAAPPDEILRRNLKISKKLKENYFNWGRNTLYHLFSSLPCKKITFPAFTCPTLIWAAEKAGKKVILAEIDLNTFNLDIEKIPLKTKCLVAVHTFGNPVDISKIKKRLGDKAFIIEDCAHAIFSKQAGKYVGCQGDAILFSFYKQIANINGALLFSKKKLIETQSEEGVLKHARRLIIKTNGWHQKLLDLKRRSYLPKIERQRWTDFKPSHLTFFLFSSGLKKLKKEVGKRQKTAFWYQKRAEKSRFFYPQIAEKKDRPSFYQFALRLEPQLAGKREEIVMALRKKDVIIDRLWHQAPIAMERYKRFRKKCPHALLLAKTIINLPIKSDYTKGDVNELFKKIDETIMRFKA